MSPVSIVVPAHNEERLIGASVQQIRALLDRVAPGSQIVVCDAASDDGTAAAVTEADVPGVRLLSSPTRSKGATVTLGLTASRCDPLGFIDADLDINVGYIPSMLEALEEGYDAAIAVKDPTRDGRPWTRRLLTRAYNSAARTLLRTPFTDHQAGLKLFRREPLMTVLPRVRSRGFLWDTELLLRLHRNGCRIHETPVELAGESASSVPAPRMIVSAVFELVRLLGSGAGEEPRRWGRGRGARSDGQRGRSDE